jgi:hypothetical protein
LHEADDELCFRHCVLVSHACSHYGSCTRQDDVDYGAKDCYWLVEFRNVFQFFPNEVVVLIAHEKLLFHELLRLLLHLLFPVDFAWWAAATGSKLSIRLRHLHACVTSIMGLHFSESIYYKINKNKFFILM